MLRLSVFLLTLPAVLSLELNAPLCKKRRCGERGQCPGAGCFKWLLHRLSGDDDEPGHLPTDDEHDGEVVIPPDGSIKYADYASEIAWYNDPVTKKQIVEDENLEELLDITLANMATLRTIKKGQHDPKGPEPKEPKWARYY